MQLVFISKALSGEAVYSRQDIAKLLQQRPAVLQRGKVLLGKINTEVYESPKHIVKLHYYQAHNEKATQKWVENKHQQQQQLGIYPPDKTWFLVKIDGQLYPGNICQKLFTLHEAVLTQKNNCELFNHHLAKCYSMVLNIAAAFDYQLDMGLSNFACCTKGRLYYVDDDLYRWDNFLTFAQSIAAHFREIPITELNIKYLANAIKIAFEHNFKNDQNYLEVIEQQMRVTFIPAPLEAYYEQFFEYLSGNNKANTLEKKHWLSNLENFENTAVLADIHGNIHALEAVLNDINKQGIDKLIVLGDVVGYGPNPNECINRLASLNMLMVQGNHDQAAVQKEVGKGFNKEATWAMQWTIANLGEQQRQWLSQQPMFIKNNDSILQHGAPMDPYFCKAYVYETTYQKNLDYMQNNNLRFCFHGHTHIPGVYYRGHQGDGFVHQKTVSLCNMLQTLICPGSVGKPRLQSGMAAQYLIWKPKQQQLEFCEVDYPVHKHIQEVRLQQFPELSYRAFNGA